jgi:hypothetical protein
MSDCWTSRLTGFGGISSEREAVEIDRAMLTIAESRR